MDTKNPTPDSGTDSAAVIKFESELMSRREAAAYLGISEVTLAIWKSTKRHYLKVYKIGRLAKYKKSDLDEFIASKLQA